MSHLPVHTLHGAADAPWLTLSHPIGATLEIWDGLMPELARNYRVLAINTHEQAGLPGAACSMDALAARVQQLWQALGITRSHFLGLSLGGCIGVSLALRSPQSVRSLVVACSRLEMDDAATNMWQQRAALVEQQGMAPVVTPTLERWFTPAYLAGQPAAVEAVRQQLVACPPKGYADSARALAGLHLQERLGQLQVPTLYLAGLDDQAVPAAQIEGYARLTPGARYAALAGPHILHLENPKGFSHSVLDFFGQA
ncbi:MAG: alpha/beta fold hydrolase [Hylemonella sp.]|nr:alpha/beta fold hydrolase [Hylemonella sp.]